MMRVVALGAGLLLFAEPSAAKVTETSAKIGKLAVVTQVTDISDTPIMHVPLINREIHLEWRSSDRRVRFFLKDDGADLVESFDFTRGDLKDVVCGRYGGTLWSYQTPRGSEKRWTQFQTVLTRSLADACASVVNPAQRATYVAEFASATSDFGPALEAMKVAARQQFGGWRRRCLNYYSRRDRPDTRCVSYSAKEN